MKQFSIKTGILIIFCLAFAGGILAIMPYVVQPQPCTNYRTDVAWVRQTFTHMSAKDAYQAFKKRYRDTCPFVHDLSHLVGSLIYTKQGADGIDVCDEAFTYGCYHGFFGAAIAKEGTDFIGKAQSICQNTSTDIIARDACFHGIGHGALFALGAYTEESLIKALSLCDSIRSAEGKRSCYNGVFMEYIDRPAQKTATGQSTSESFNPSEPLVPCVDLPVAYQADCYYEQPSVWVRALQNDPRTMGNYCASIDTPEGKRGCAKGVGRALIITFTYDKERLAHACSQMRQSDVSAYCVVGALEQLIAEQKPNPMALCDIAGIDSVECRQAGKATQCAVLSICE